MQDKINTAEIDLHGLTVFDAETELLDLLDRLPKETEYLNVVHGYSHGTRLKKMVKDDFYHWRVKCKRASLNPGTTVFVLK